MKSMSSVSRAAFYARLVLPQWRQVPGWLTTLGSGRSPLEAAVPWLPFSAIQFLDQILTPESQVFEYGSGGSTLWLAKRASRLTTVEHNAEWFERVRQELELAKLSNCTLLLREPVPDVPPQHGTAIAARPYNSPIEPGDFRHYVHALDSWPDSSLDLIVVDGRCRAACLLLAGAKIRPGGILLLDDSYRSRYQAALRSYGSWHRRDLAGPRPYSWHPGLSTVLMRPG